MRIGVGWIGWLGWMALALALLPAGATGQRLEELDYENLSFRGIGLEAGWILPTRVEPTWTLGARMDLGYLGPGVRLIPGLSYWSSTLEPEEVERFEERLERLIDRQTPPGTGTIRPDLGTLEWSDLVLSMDAQLVWSVPWGFLTYAGAGAAAHILNGSGEAIADTFIEDLLDQVTAGFNLHAGAEYPVSPRWQLYGVSRLELLGDLQYIELRLGGQVMTGGPGASGGGP